jgi:hypothetical protein
MGRDDVTPDSFCKSGNTRLTGAESVRVAGNGLKVAVFSMGLRAARKSGNERTYGGVLFIKE